MRHLEEEGNAGPLDIIDLNPEPQGKDDSNDPVIDTVRKEFPQLVPVPARTQRGPGSSARKSNESSTSSMVRSSTRVRAKSLSQRKEEVSGTSFEKSQQLILSDESSKAEENPIDK